MSELHIRRGLVKMLKPIHAVPVESPIVPGIPDVNYTDGWIELKYVKDKPIRGGIVRIPHFTIQQRIWLRKRTAAGGKCWLLLVICREWLLFRGDVAAEHVGNVTLEVLREVAAEKWCNRPDREVLISCLTKEN